MLTAQGQPSLGWPTSGLSSGVGVDGHIDFSTRSGAILDPCRDAPRGWHIDFSGFSGAVLDPIDVSSYHIDFSTRSNAVLNAFAPGYHIDFSTYSGAVLDPADTTESGDDPAEPVVVNADPVIIFADVSGVVAGTNAHATTSDTATYGGVVAIFAALDTPSHTVHPSFSLTPEVYRPAGTDFTLRSRGEYMFRGESGIKNLPNPWLRATTEDGADVGGLYSHYPTYDAWRCRQYEVAHIRYAWLDGDIEPTTPGDTPWVRQSGTINFTLPGHKSPLTFPVTVTHQEAAEAIRAGLEADGLLYSVGVCANNHWSNQYPSETFAPPANEPLSPRDHRHVTVALHPMLRFGTFRIRLAGTNEASAPLNIMTCTKEDVQAALDAMPTLRARGGITVRYVARPGPYPGADYNGQMLHFTPCNELLIRF